MVHVERTQPWDDNAMSRRLWTRKTANAKRASAKDVTSKVHATPASDEDIGGKLQAILASDEFRPMRAFDEARTALANSMELETAGGRPDWMGEDAADKIGNEVDIAKQVMSAVLDIRQDPAIASPGADYVKHADRSIGSDLSGVGVDILADAASGVFLQAAVGALVVRNVREAYRDWLSRLPTVVHPEVSFTPSACWLIAIRNWQVAIVLPWDKDKLEAIPQATIMNQADTWNWLTQLQNRPRIRLSATQSQMLAAFTRSDGKANASILAVVSPPWPPTRMKIRKVWEFRSWRYHTARDRVEVSWQQPYHSGGLGLTSFYVLTYPSLNVKEDSDVGTATARITHRDPNGPTGPYENVNSIAITGLDTGVTYTFAVVAANRLGLSTRSWSEDSSTTL
jgi:hypothetical protein